MSNQDESADATSKQPPHDIARAIQELKELVKEEEDDTAAEDGDQVADATIESTPQNIARGIQELGWKHPMKEGQRG